MLGKFTSTEYTNNKGLALDLNRKGNNRAWLASPTEEPELRPHLPPSPLPVPGPSATWRTGRRWSGPWTSGLSCWVPAPPKQWRCASLPGPTLGLRSRRQAAAAASDTDPTAKSAAARPTRQQAAPYNFRANFSEHKTEYSRYQRWRHLEIVLNQSEACSSESQPHSSALIAPSSPGSSWMKKDQPTFTLW